MTKRRHPTPIGVIAAPGVPHASAMAEALRAIGASVRSIEVGNALTPGLMSLGSEPVPVDFKVAFVDALPLGVPRAFLANGVYHLWDDWQRDWLESIGRRALLDALFADLVRQGVTLVSSPLSVAAYNKPAQLLALARGGLPVPRFVITNDVDVATNFVRSVGEAVCKPPMGGGFCVPIKRDQVADLLSRRAPAILQERVRGDDIRINAVRGKVLSAVRVVNDGADSAVPDFRAQQAYRAGTTRYEPIAVTAKLTKLCTRILTTCDMHFGGIDFKRDAKGNLHLLECNVQPGFLAIEQATGHAICAGLAAYLAELSQATSRARRR